MKFLVYKISGSYQKYLWVAIAKNGKRVARSRGSGYTRKQDAVRGINYFASSLLVFGTLSYTIQDEEGGLLL